MRILDKHGNPRWHDIWEGNPRIARPTDRGSFPSLVNGSGCRPYIDYARSTRERWAYRPEWRSTPADIFGVSADPRAAGYVVIEPTIKRGASPNKQWGRWQELVDAMPDVQFAQLGPAGSPWLRGVTPIETRTFREALGVLAAADMLVLPEGGLHHGAAALARPAIVLFGGVMHPRTTGYELHTNLYVDAPDAVGWRVPHPAAAAAWQEITVETVLCELRKRLQD